MKHQSRPAQTTKMTTKANLETMKLLSRDLGDEKEYPRTPRERLGAERELRLSHLPGQTFLPRKRC
jgi:hypothetical protein